MLVIDKENFEEEVLQAKGLVVVDFWGPKCEPCLALMPAIEELAKKYSDRAKIGKVNASENRRLCISQRVMGLPTILFFKDGERVSDLTGEITVEAIEEKIEELL